MVEQGRPSLDLVINSVDQSMSYQCDAKVLINFSTFGKVDDALVSGQEQNAARRESMSTFGNQSKLRFSKSHNRIKNNVVSKRGEIK